MIRFINLGIIAAIISHIDNPWCFFSLNISQRVRIINKASFFSTIEIEEEMEERLEEEIEGIEPLTKLILLWLDLLI